MKGEKRWKDYRARDQPGCERNSPGEGGGEERGRG